MVKEENAINEKQKMFRGGNEGMSTIPGFNQIQFEGFCRFIDQGLTEELSILGSFWFEIHDNIITSTLSHNQDYLLVVSFGKPHMVLKLRKSRINALNESQFKVDFDFEL